MLHVTHVLAQMWETEVPVARSLLGSLVQLLPSLSAVDEHDVRMQGKLELLLQLMHILGSQAMPSNESQQLVQLLMTGWIADVCSGQSGLVLLCTSLLMTCVLTGLSS